MTDEAPKERAVPDRYVPAWQEIVDASNRRRVAVEIRIAPGTELEDDGETLRGSFLLFLRNRGGGEPDQIGSAKTFEEAINKLGAKLGEIPLPGPDQLRIELRRFGRRLAVLSPRDVANRRKGVDLPLYRDFRDRILPLAWDNLVESVRVEALEDFVRKVGDLAPELEKVDGAPHVIGHWRELAAEARGLVAPKEGSDGSDASAPPDEPEASVQPTRTRRRRAKPTEAE
jgi:hypothetical protein